MFSRTTKDAEAQAPAAPRRPAVASLIAEGVRIRGDLATAGDVHLDGSVEGDLRAGALTIGETGAVTGSVQADTVEVRGRVTGTIAARQVRLLATAHVDGDVTHAELSIETGAHFEGRSLVLAPAEATPVELSVAAE
jgi:cytoskeletal protein CcmA (bactofilin family)